MRELGGIVCFCLSLYLLAATYMLFNKATYKLTLTVESNGHIDEFVLRAHPK